MKAAGRPRNWGRPGPRHAQTASQVGAHGRRWPTENKTSDINALQPASCRSTTASRRVPFHTRLCAIASHSAESRGRRRKAEERARCWRLLQSSGWKRIESSRAEKGVARGSAAASRPGVKRAPYRLLELLPDVRVALTALQDCSEQRRAIRRRDGGLGQLSKRLLHPLPPGLPERAQHREERRGDVGDAILAAHAHNGRELQACEQRA